MNILVVCQELPYPLDGGCKIRLFNLLKHLSRNHNISLVCWAGSGNQKDHICRMEEYCESIRLVRRKKKSKIRQLPGLIKNLISGLPWSIKDTKSIEMMDTIMEVVKAKPFDILHIDDIDLTCNFDFFCNKAIKKALTFHNIESINYRRIFKIEKNLYKKMLFLLNWLPMQRWEGRIAEKFDLNIVVSYLDYQILKVKNEKIKITIIPNGVDTDSFSPLPFSDQQQNILFIGIMDYPPNKDAVLYFYKQIFPLIKVKLPYAKFWIIGQKPNKKLWKLSKDPNVVLTGYVENVMPYYERSSVVVVPLRAGGGTRGKILEAMALGRPVVSTSLGAEGLEVTQKENIMIADNPKDFANHTIELMTNTSLRKTLTEKAREFVESYHSWRQIAEKLDQVYQEICNLK